MCIFISTSDKLWWTCTNIKCCRGTAAGRPSTFTRMTDKIYCTSHVLRSTKISKGDFGSIFVLLFVVEKRCCVTKNVQNLYQIFFTFKLVLFNITDKFWINMFDSFNKSESFNKQVQVKQSKWFYFQNTIYLSIPKGCLIHITPHTHYCSLITLFTRLSVRGSSKRIWNNFL